MSASRRRRRRLSDRAWTLTGWWLFCVCAGFFIIASVRAADPVALAGSLFFMAANIAFMIPFYRRPNTGGDEHEE